MEFTHTIDGRSESSEAFFDVIDPASGASSAQCPDASKEQLDRAVAAARSAFGAWSSLSFEGRRGYLRRFAEMMRQRGAELIPLLVREQGKPLSSAIEEITHAPEQIERIASLEAKNEILRDDGHTRIELRYRPGELLAESEAMHAGTRRQ